ncbi:MAG: beta-ketoacyl-ACP reductase [Epsilonproteobacteria bacterium]|nr:MAG: beta-ketoacyl-ACP reductase [Campylobacterota bacterium]RLA65777.1 MAG: beta-ketoacyl-ACP reductase [Campylobacterota bacterium]
MSFVDQRVIVTGGTRGIGKGIAKEFLKEGATVIATYSSNDAEAEKFKIEFREYADRLDIRKFDVSNSEEVQAFYDYLDNTYPSIEVLVNNAGIRKDSLVPLMKEDDFKEVIDINLNGTFLMSKYAVKSFLRKRYGRIVNISSVGGKLGLAGQANYSASKAGQIALAKSMSKEVGKKGITINCVCPGFIETELIADLPEEQVKGYKMQVPLKRFGRVEEVAVAVKFLASQEASYITGTTLDVSGGL